jgi:hypothetical protein
VFESCRVETAHAFFGWTNIRFPCRSLRLAADYGIIPGVRRSVKASTRPSKISGLVTDESVLVASISLTLSVVAAPCQTLILCCWRRITASSTQEYGIRGGSEASTRLLKLSTLVLGKSHPEVLSGHPKYAVGRRSARSFVLNCRKSTLQSLRIKVATCSVLLCEKATSNSSFAYLAAQRYRNQPIASRD